MNKQEATELVINAYRELAEDLNLPDADSVSAETKLFGSGSSLDSVGLVTLISEIEQLVEEQTDQQIVLTDERAMSRSRSPFRSIDVLADYICERLNEDNSDA